MAYGSDTYTAQTQVNISCGFKPKLVMVEVIATNSRILTLIYDSRISTTRVQYNSNLGVNTNYSANSGYSGFVNLDNGTNNDIGITNDGFYFKFVYAGTYHYIAIPE